MPAFRKFIEMPPPMVPAPITATFSILRVGVSDGTSGILLAARSPKKAWRSARDSGVLTRNMKPSRSRRRPSSKGFSEAATASTHLPGAGKFFATAATVFLAKARKPSAFSWRTFRSRTLGCGPDAAPTLRAKAIAAGSTSPSTISSNSLVPANFSDSTGLPVTIMLSAASRPITRGRRCVPPAPGRMPSLTSGSAICAPFEATR